MAEGGEEDLCPRLPLFRERHHPEEQVASTTPTHLKSVHTRVPSLALGSGLFLMSKGALPMGPKLGEVRLTQFGVVAWNEGSGGFLGTRSFALRFQVAPLAEVFVQQRSPRAAASLQR